MQRQYRAFLVGSAALLLLASGGLLPAAAAAPPAKAPSATDLTGLWTNASYTKLQRPKAFKSLVVSPDEARAFEASLAKHHGVTAFGEDTVGQLDSEFSDSGDGLARIDGQIRSSWIVDPANGRIPYTPAGRKLLGLDDDDRYDNPEDLDASARCMTGNGSAPPQTSAMDANELQIIQTPNEVLLASEKNHDVRIIHLNQPRDPNRPASWAGESVGHWEGATLVVDTRGFREPVVDRFFLAYTKGAVIKERFTRTSPTQIRYLFTVTDPAVFSQPWRGEMVFNATTKPMYEYACHEGNYSLPSMLRAARLGRQPPPKPTAAPNPSSPKPTP